ncbi:2-oxo acid dehydrogenase subunit E2 [Occultella aeris]|uniref:Dihydrolipoamide acetyltransferase component of pyruvate dehydrogenase complex n=1 Tax=Occultella aeris TaxID=2761496 RepID=A0A7M4DJ46_9MICO|nr:2-oxo acid dehydrogenase subunit E2 [Occultella aeris]VZO37030.1 Dihydrolipoyllysine-residue acetyltransferase component of pyruvate dehydrogenase complex [Occultella aeris]
MPTIVRMPEVLANATEGVLATWLVAEGASVRVGQPLAEIETEKAVVEYQAESDGVLGRRLVAAGATVDVGAPIAVLLAPGEDDAVLAAFLAQVGQEDPTPDGGAGPAGEVAVDGGSGGGAGPDGGVDSGGRVAVGGGSGAAPNARDDAPAAGELATRGGRIFASPLARKLARDRGLDLASLRGSGPRGRIVRRDVEAAASAADTTDTTDTVRDQPATAVGQDRSAKAAVAFTDVPHTRMRRAIARRLTESKATVPHYYLSAEIRVDALLDLRRRINADGGRRVSVNDLVVRAVAAAHERVPNLNASWTDDAVRHFTGVDVAVAVSTDHGLYTPVVRGVERMRLRELSEAIADLAARARERRLRQDELEGGSFTVSNLGAHGVREFAAIINPPHAGILAVGAAEQRPVVTDGALAIATVMTCTLSADHRIADGVVAAQWLAAFTRVVEEPVSMLV